MGTVIKTTYIDTASHGYYSVSKKDFLKVCTPEQITGFSGHNLTRIYLEEDCDASTFFNEAKKKGIKITDKRSYNEKFSCKHNYQPELFSYSPQLNDILTIFQKEYSICEIGKKKIIVTNGINRFSVPFGTIFKYISAFKRENPIN